MSGSSKYLRLFQHNGDWIERPDYMVLAALSTSDEISIEHIYEAMVLEEKINPSLDQDEFSQYAQKLREQSIKGDLPNRVLAGEVVLELARLAYTTQRPPTSLAAIRLVTYNHFKRFPKSSPISVDSKVVKAFRRYRKTAHLHAVAVYDPQLLEDIEGDQASLQTFLGLARAFEGFIDDNVLADTFKWQPLRVPEQIARVSEITFKPLTDEELSAARAS